MFPDEIDTLPNAALIGSVATGLLATTKDGRPAQLAILDADGQILEVGPDVAREAWAIVVTVYNNVLMSQGHLVVHTSPPGLATCTHRELKRATQKTDS